MTERIKCPTCDGSGLQLTGNVASNGVEEVGGCYDCAATGTLNYGDSGPERPDLLSMVGRAIDAERTRRRVSVPTSAYHCIVAPAEPRRRADD